MIHCVTNIPHPIHPSSRACLIFSVRLIKTMGSRKFLSETKLQVINIVFSQEVIDYFIGFSGISSTFDKREMGR